MPKLKIILAFVVALIMAAILAGMSPAHAQTVIDDFESHDFYIQAPGNTVVQTVVVNDRAHCLAGNRKLTATADGGASLVVASLDAGFVFDDATVIDFLNGGEMKIEYVLGAPTDLTEGGTFDRIEIMVPEVTTDAVIWCWRHASGGSIGATEYVSSPGVASFDLLPGNFDTAVTRIEIIVLPQNPGSDGRVRLADIRTKRNNSLSVQLLGDFVATQIPPIPSPPLIFRAFDLIGQPLYESSVALQYVENLGLTPGATWEWFEAPFYEGEFGIMEFRWDNFDAIDNMITTMSVDLSPANGSVPEIMGTPIVLQGNEAFAVMFDLLIRDGGGVPIATSRTTMMFGLGKYQEFTFEDEMVTMHAGAKRTKQAAGVTGFDVDFRLDGNNFEQNEPIYYVTWVSDYSTSVPTGVLAGAFPALDTDAGLALLATPSVTRGATEIRANRALGVDAMIEIYDITGRLVRTLRPARSTASVVWDGSDESGARAPSGVYFARAQGAGAGVDARATRIVRIR